MFGASTRGTVIWLLIVGVALALTLAAGSLPTGAAAALLAAYLAVVVLVAQGAEIRTLVNSLPRRAGEQPAQPTEVAREASARARGYPGFDRQIRLLDIGLIVDEQRPDGMSLRRGRFISLDDDAIRPFGIVEVPAGLGDRLATLRFEIRDEAGKAQYIFEDEQWLEAGQNVLLPGYRFPIRKQAGDLGAGAWSARVAVDGGLLGVHHFNVSPSLAMRRQQLGADGEVLRERIWRSDTDDEALPVSLEELLRQQSREREG